MNAWLTLPIRLLVVGLLGVCLWVTITSTASKLPWMETEPEYSALETYEPYVWIQTTLDSGAAIVILVAIFGIAIVIAHQLITYRRFKRVVEKIESLGGSIRFTPEVDHPWLHFFFCKSHVDLRNSEINDECFPLFRHIPRLHSIRLSDTEPGDNMLAEIAHCRALISLDVALD